MKYGHFIMFFSLKKTTVLENYYFIFYCIIFRESQTSREIFRVCFSFIIEFKNVLHLTLFLRWKNN